MAIRLDPAQLAGILAKGHCRLNTSAGIPCPTFAKPTASRNTKRMPQDILWAEVHAKWGDRAQAEYRALPNRRFRIDIAFPAEKVAVEVDGWQYHGKYKADFKNGLKRQNLLTEHGWSFLRFTAGEIHGELKQCLQTIERAINSVKSN